MPSDWDFGLLADTLPAVPQQSSKISGLLCVPGEDRGDRIVCAHCFRPLEFKKVAFSYKKLLREKYFQTPQGRAGLELLHRRYPRDPRVLNWLMREYRRGRLIVSPQWMDHTQRLMNAEAAGDPYYIDEANKRLNDPHRPDIVLWDTSHTDPHGNPSPVQPGLVPAIGQMMDQASSSGRGLDIMQYTYPDLLPLYQKWNSERRKRDPNSGEVVHAFPNGYTMRRLTTPDEAHVEGEEMGNCLPKFAPSIGNGDFHVFSLRDEKNAPHANVLVSPLMRGGHWDGGIVRDIRGKQNAIPEPEYHQMVSQWLHSFNTTPQVRWDPYPAGKSPGEPADYGLVYHPSYQEQGPYPQEGYFPGGEVHEASIGPWIFTADKLNDHLRNPQQRPDLQTPEAQQFLNFLQNRLHSPETDSLMPFLTKEWKAGRIKVENNSYGEPYRLAPTNFSIKDIPDPGIREDIQRTYDQSLEDGRTPEEALQEAQARLSRHWGNTYGPEISPQKLVNMARWLKSKHPTAKGLNLLDKNLSWDQVADKHEEYARWLAEKKDQASRVKNFEGPEGEYLKRLLPEQVRWEGKEMQNCLGTLNYDSKIRTMRSLIYSLRDKNGNPKVDIEIHPQWAYNPATRERKQINTLTTEERDSGDWEMLPQEGKVYQIQGKFNSPPQAKYHPLIKQYFQSEHFLPRDKATDQPTGEDYRPQWQFSSHGTHFNDMKSLWSGAEDQNEGIGQHICYYHPGDYGLPDAGVTSDYNGLVRTLDAGMHVDPEGKRVKHLVNWAMYHDELPQLREALEGNQNYFKGKTVPFGGVGDDPGYTQWQEANPEPQRPEGLGDRFQGAYACPNCGHQGEVHVDRYGRGNHYCRWCGSHFEDPRMHRLLEDTARRQFNDRQQRLQQQFDQQWNPWNAEQTRQYDAARARLGEQNWEGSPYQQMYDQAHSLIDQRMAMHDTAPSQQAPEGTQDQQQSPWYKRIFSAVEEDAGNPWCRCGHCGYGDWDFVKTANYNKVRNMLRKNQILTPENKFALDAIQHNFPDHGDLAEWLHREFRKGRLSFHGPGVHQHYSYYMEQAGQNEKEYRTYMELGNNPDTPERDREYYLRNAETYKQNAKENREAAEGYLANADPNDVNVKVPGEQANREHGGPFYLQPEHLDEIRSIMRKRAQRWKSAPEEVKQEWEQADPTQRRAWGTLIQHKREYDRLDRNGRPEFSDWLRDQHRMPDYEGHNPLQEPQILKSEIGEVLPEAREAARRTLGLKLGKTLWTSPEGWTVRYINSPEAASLESEMLGHCIGGYGDKILGGTSNNFSLRDPQGEAHATWDLKPTKPHIIDWDPLYQNAAKLHGPAICPDCGGPLDENATCQNCGNQVDVNTDLDFSPDELDRLKGIHQELQEAEKTHPQDYGDKSALWSKFLQKTIPAGLAVPDVRGATGRQFEGKSGVAPIPKYHGYVRQWAESMPYDERPKSGWGSYFTTQPVMHHSQLQDYIDKVDELGFQAPSRTVDWNGVVNSLSGAAPNWGSSSYLTPNPDPDAKYDPALGQKALDFAQANGMNYDLYRTLNSWGKPQPRGRTGGRCPSCGSDDVSMAYYGPGDNYCYACGTRFPDPPPPRGTGPAYTPYQAQVVQHMGPVLANDPQLELLGTHGADQIVKPKCSNCGGEIGPCQACPAPDHGQCANCGNVAFYPQPDPQWPQPPAGGGVFAKVASVKCLKFHTTTPHIGYHGQECHCLWHPDNDPDNAELSPSPGEGGWDFTALNTSSSTSEARVPRLSRVVTADKFNDYLMNPQARPDLQTPEAQSFLRELQQFHNDKVDPLTPWLTREWKKGRVFLPGQSIPDDAGGRGTMVPNYMGYHAPDGRATPLAPYLNHWGDWYGSNHPTRRGVDIMKMQMPDMHNKIAEWDQAMADEAGGAAAQRGKVVHHWPDGWTVQKLTDPAHLKEEGDKMGHCVGGYHQAVQDGNALIYSLRDDKNEPHATWEITPTNYQCGNCGSINGRRGLRERHCDCAYDNNVFAHPGNELVPHSGSMVQIQGKANKPPLPEYQQRIKDWVQATFNQGDKDDEDDRPRWDDQEFNDADELRGDDGYTEYHPGDYGLETPQVSYDWEDILNSIQDRNEDYDWGHRHNLDGIAAHAADHGELESLQNELEDYHRGAEANHRNDFEDHWNNLTPNERSNYYDVTPWEDSWHHEEPPSEDDHTEKCPECDGEGEDEEGDECASCDGSGEIPDENAYQEAYENWEHENEMAEERYWQDEMEDARDRHWDDDPRNSLYDELTGEVQAQRRMRHQARRLTHPNFSTGQPCRCTFTTHLKPAISEDWSFDGHEASLKSSDMEREIPMDCPHCGCSDGLHGPTGANNFDTIHCRGCGGQWSVSADMPLIQRLDVEDARSIGPEAQREFGEEIPDPLMQRVDQMPKHQGGWLL